MSKKFMQEGKRFLLEKIQRVEIQQQWLLGRIEDIPASAISDARNLLEGADKKTFTKRYSHVSAALEASFNALLLLAASFPSAENENGDSDSSSTTDQTSNDDNTSVYSSLTTTTASSYSSATASTRSASESGQHQDGGGGGAGGVQCGAAFHRQMPINDGKTLSRPANICQRKPSTQRNRAYPVSSDSGGTLGAPESGMRDSDTSDVKSKNVPSVQTCQDPQKHPATDAKTAMSHRGSLATSQQGRQLTIDEPRTREGFAAPPGLAPMGEPTQHQSQGCGGPTTTEPPPPGLQTPRQTDQSSHPSLGVGQPGYRITEELQTAVIRPKELKDNDHIQVVVSEVSTPARFWAQPADSPLSSLTHALQNFYANRTSISIPVPKLGMFCVASYTRDNCWYRARIVGILSKTPGQPVNLEDVVKVLYVDFGNQEKLCLTRIRVIQPNFTRLPAQAVLCSLRKIIPPSSSSGWMKSQTHIFKSLVADKIVEVLVSTLEGHPTPYLDMSVPYTTARAGNSSVTVQIDVGATMVERDLAQYKAGFGPPDKPLQPKPRPLTAGYLATSVECQPVNLGGGGGVATAKSEEEGEKVPTKFDKVAVETCANAAISEALELVDTLTEGRQSSEIPNEGSSSRELPRAAQEPWAQTGRDEVVDRHCKDEGGSLRHRQMTADSLNRQEGKGRVGSSVGSSPPGGQSSFKRSRSKWAGRGPRFANRGSSTVPSTCESVLNHQQVIQAGRNESKGLARRRGDNQMRGNEHPRERKSAGLRLPPEAGKTFKEIAPTSEDNRQETISPNSSSGVSSCTSGLSESIVPKNACSSEKDDQSKGNADPRREDMTRNDQRFGPANESATQPSSRELRANSKDRSNLKEAQKEGDRAAPREEAPFKPLSASSKNLSSSASSFFSCMADLDNFKPDTSDKELGSDGSSALAGQASARGDEAVKPPPCLRRRASLQSKYGCIRLAMSHIVSPVEFYVHLITPDAEVIDSLSDELNDFYGSEKADSTRERLQLEPGAYCAARYTADGLWYRAEILDVQSQGKADENSKQVSGEDDSTKNLIKKVQVRYIDYGNLEWQLVEAIKPLLSRFYEIPAQVIKCSLAHVYPPETTLGRDGNSKSTTDCKEASLGQGSKWPEETADELARMTGFKKMLSGRLTREYDPDSKDPLPIILLDPTSPWEICINQELVNCGLAASKRFLRPTPPDDTLSQEPTRRQLMMASEGWHLKKYVEGGYDPVPEDAAAEEVNRSKVKGLNDHWDPMSSDFNSERNSYHIDVDDPGMATVGYSANSVRQICKYYAAGKACYRGNQCSFEHAKPGEKPLESVDAFCFNVRVMLPPMDSWVALEVTALFSAFHFWAQLPYAARPLDELQKKRATNSSDDGEETLELLEESLNLIYSASESHHTTNLLLRAQGEMVCCRSPLDGRWYRARVREINPAEDMIQVFYVDYGNTEWVRSSSVRDIQPQFLYLPLQAVECHLSGVQPLDKKPEAGARPDEAARQFFEELTCNKTLIANITHVTISNNLVVELYDTSGKSDINIGEALLENGLAIREDWRSYRGAATDQSVSSVGRGSLPNVEGGEMSSRFESSSEEWALVPG